jgi:hypothetical protein
MGSHNSASKQDNLRSAYRLAEAHTIAPLLGKALHTANPTIFKQPATVDVNPHQGCENMTFLASCGNHPTRYIVRLHELSLNETEKGLWPAFEKDRFISTRLRGNRLIAPIPENSTGRLTVSTSALDCRTFGYMIQELLPYQSARQSRNPPHRYALLHQLGEILHDIHAIELTGFGSEFQSDGDRFAHSSFADSIEAKVRAIEQVHLPKAMPDWIRHRSESLARIDTNPLLSHRDVLANPGNVLVDGRGTIQAIIDWELANSGLAFHTEVASLIYTLYRDGHSPARIEHDLKAFLQGYGMSYQHYKRHYEHDVESVVLLNAISAIAKVTAASTAGKATIQPWRRVFAKRALELCQTLFTRDQSGRAKARLVA